MKSLEHDNQEIKWYTKIVYMDEVTNQEITREEAIESYVIIKSKTTRNVNRSTGTITHTKQCRKSGQFKLF